MLNLFVFTKLSYLIWWTIIFMACHFGLALGDDPYESAGEEAFHCLYQGFFFFHFLFLIFPMVNTSIIADHLVFSFFQIILKKLYH